METISIIVTVISLAIGLVKLFSGSDKPAESEREYFVTANMKVPEETIKASGIDAGEVVKLQLTAEPQTVSVHATGTSWTPVHLGNITDYELYSKVINGRATAKIYAINGDIVTIEFNYR